jgi:hypothetical protein
MAHAVLQEWGERGGLDVERVRPEFVRTVPEHVAGNLVRVESEERGKVETPGVVPNTTVSAWKAFRRTREAASPQRMSPSRYFS